MLHQKEEPQHYSWNKITQYATKWCQLLQTLKIKLHFYKRGQMWHLNNWWRTLKIWWHIRISKVCCLEKKIKNSTMNCQSITKNKNYKKLTIYHNSKRRHLSGIWTMMENWLLRIYQRLDSRRRHLETWETAWISIGIEASMIRHLREQDNGINHQSQNSVLNPLVVFQLLHLKKVWWILTDFRNVTSKISS